MDLWVAGGENRLLALARAIDRDRFDLIVVTICRSDPEHDRRFGPMREHFRKADIEVVELGEPPCDWDDLPAAAQPAMLGTSGLLTKGGNLVRRVGRLARLLRERRIDLVDAHVFPAIYYGALAGRLAGVRSVMATAYDGDFRQTLSPHHFLYTRLIFRLVDVLVSDSRIRCAEMSASLRIPRLRTAVIPNGIFPPTTDRAGLEMRRQFGLPEDPRVRVIGQISRLLPGKGHQVLLEAACRVLKCESDVAFLICGYENHPGYRKELEARVSALGLVDRVRIVSYPGPIGDVWSTIDIHAHASLFDSAPIAITEGMALGKPVVVTSTGGIPDLVEHERTGLVVQPGNPEAFANALLVLLQNPDKAQRFGRAARERYEMQHRPEAMANTLGNLFIELINRT
jgi:glycosyltransferase involved in cell wall biosynthesis